MALSIYDKQNLSAEDQERVKNLQKAYITASKAGDKAGKESAAAAAENIRRAYGYSGGGDGQGYVALPGHEGASEMQKAGSDLDSAYSGINDAFKAQAEASKEEIDKQRAATLKQAYIGNMMDQKNIDQQMRAGGITGGLSESARVAMQNAYRTNRNSANAAAINAKKDVDLSMGQAIAQNEVNRAGAKYNAGVANAQFQNAAANNNRNIKLTEESNKLAKQQSELSNIVSLASSGYLNEDNASLFAKTYGLSEEGLRAVARARESGDYESVVLNLLNAGIYDDSFVDALGGRFSADLLKEYAGEKRPSTSKTASDDAAYNNVILNKTPEPALNLDDYTYEQITGYAESSNYGANFDENDWVEAAADMGVSVEQVKKLFTTIKNLRGIK